MVSKLSEDYFCTNINRNLQRSSQLYTFQSTPAGENGENGDHALRAVMGALGPVLESVFSRIPEFPFLKDTVMQQKPALEIEMNAPNAIKMPVKVTTLI